MARVCTAKLSSLSPYSPSRNPFIDRAEKESAADLDARVWREKSHYDANTLEMFIPPMAFKFAIAEAAKRLAIKIPGKGQQLYTKNILSGVLTYEPVRIGVSRDDAAREPVWCHANGKRGSGTRVMRAFPVVHSWKADFNFAVIDDEIPKEIVERCLKEAGSLIGVGRFRPENGGYFGRFTVENMKWSEQ